MRSIKIYGNVVNLKPSLLSIDRKGNGGTKISTITRFAELQTFVYKPFVRGFLKKAADRRLKRVASVAPCLAIVDGGTEPRMSFVKASIVIGGYQLEENLLAFDVASSKLSFSSSLLLHNVTCSHL